MSNRGGLALLALGTVGCHRADTLEGLGVDDLRVSFTHTAAIPSGGATAVVEFMWPGLDNHCSTVENVTVTLGGVEMAPDQAALGGTDSKGFCLTSARYTLTPDQAPTNHGVQQLVILEDRAVGTQSLSFDIQSPYRPRHLVPSAPVAMVKSGQTLTFEADDGLPVIGAHAWLQSNVDQAIYSVAGRPGTGSFDVTLPTVAPGPYRLVVQSMSDAMPDCPITYCDAEVSAQFVHQVDVTE